MGWSSEGGRHSAKYAQLPSEAHKGPGLSLPIERPWVEREPARSIARPACLLIAADGSTRANAAEFGFRLAFRREGFRYIQSPFRPDTMLLLPGEMKQ